MYGIANQNDFSKYPLCTYGVADSCQNDSYCVFIQKNEARCLPFLEGELPKVHFPFESDHSVRCWKSIDPNADSSHAWLNTRFAVDLYSKQNDNGIILAGVNGFVVAHSGCETNHLRLIQIGGTKRRPESSLINH